jgi:hypothetical protein
VACTPRPGSSRTLNDPLSQYIPATARRPQVSPTMIALPNGARLFFFSSVSSPREFHRRRPIDLLTIIITDCSYEKDDDAAADDDDDYINNNNNNINININDRLRGSCIVFLALCVYAIPCNNPLISSLD